MRVTLLVTSGLHINKQVALIDQTSDGLTSFPKKFRAVVVVPEGTREVLDFFAWEVELLAVDPYKDPPTPPRPSISLRES